jgi:hypothetical protein
MCADLAKDIVAGLTGNSEWRLDVLDNFGKPVFRVQRELAEIVATPTRISLCGEGEWCGYPEECRLCYI